MRVLLTKFAVSLLCFLLFTSLLTISAIQAQTGTTPTEEELREEDAPAIIEDVPELRAELTQKVQNSKTKEVTFEMILHSNVRSDKVRVTWDIFGESAFAKDSQRTQTLSIEKGKTYTVEVVVIPIGEGVTELTGKAESFELGNSFIVTVRKNYASNADGEILPITYEYKSAKTQTFIMDVVTYIIIIVVIVLSGFLGLKLLLKWYDRDEVKAFDENRQDTFQSDSVEIIKSDINPTDSVKSPSK